MSLHYKSFEQIMTEAARELGVNITRNIDVKVHCSKRIDINDFPWTPKEVEKWLVTAFKAEVALPTNERALLYKALQTSSPEPLLDWSDDVARLNERQKYFWNKKIHIQWIDRIVAVGIWMMLLKREEDRFLLHAVRAQKAAGRDRIDWRRVMHQTGLVGIKPMSVKARYSAILKKLADKLNESCFPRTPTP